VPVTKVVQRSETVQTVDSATGQSAGKDDNYAVTGNQAASALGDVEKPKSCVLLWTSPPAPALEGVHSLAYSPNGMTIAIVEGDYKSQAIILWDVATGRPITTLKRHSSSVLDIAFSPDGKTLASSAENGMIKLWDVTSGKETSSLEGHDKMVRSVAFSPDGKTLASCANEGEIKLWDVATSKEITAMSHGTYLISDVTFSPDGKTLASGTGDGTIKLWDVPSGKQITTLAGPRNREVLSEAVNSVTFSPDGKTLASGADDGTIKLWDVAAGKQSATLKGHDGHVYSVTFSPDGKTLASGSGDDKILLWNVASGKQTASLEGFGGLVTCVVFSPDGKTLASGSPDERCCLKLWDVATASQKLVSEGHWSPVSSVAFTRDGKTLASLSWDGTILLWDVPSGKQKNCLIIPYKLKDGGGIMSISFSPDGKTLASSSFESTIILWDVVTGKQTASLRGHTKSVSRVAFSPDGKTLASGSYDKTVKLWDVVTGKQTVSLDGHTQTVKRVAFSPDGKTLISCVNDSLLTNNGLLRLWDVATGKQIDHVEGCSLSSDGRVRASVGADNTIKLRDAITGKQIASLEGSTDVKEDCIALSPDGKVLAVATICYNEVRIATILLWNVASGEQLAKIERKSSINDLAFSPDGMTIAIGTSDHTVELWDVSHVVQNQTADKDGPKGVPGHNPDIYVPQNSDLSQHTNAIVIGEDSVLQEDADARRQLVAQAKSYYAMFNMADRKPSMRAGTLSNPMLIMWGGSAEKMLQEMIKKSDKYNCPESKKRYEHCLKLCQKWRKEQDSK
jgi:WD40 repeat protein